MKILALLMLLTSIATAQQCFDLPPASRVSPQWRRDANGCWVRVKYRSDARVWAPGMALFIGSYFASYAGGWGLDSRFFVGVPVVGAFYAAFGGASSTGFGWHSAGYLMSGVGQLGGFVMMIVGAASKKVVEVAPLPLRDGAGLSVGARF